MTSQGTLLVKNSTCQCRRCKRHRFSPWVEVIPWSMQWQPTPVLLSGESHGQRSLVGYSPWGRKESDTTERLNSSTRWVVLQGTQRSSLRGGSGLHSSRPPWLLTAMPAGASRGSLGEAVRGFSFWARATPAAQESGAPQGSSAPWCRMPSGASPGLVPVATVPVGSFPFQGRDPYFLSVPHHLLSFDPGKNQEAARAGFLLRWSGLGSRVNK